MYDAKDKVVLITGGASGIGAKTAEEFLKEGAKEVNIIDIDETNGNTLANELKAKYGERIKFTKCDVTDEDQILLVFESILKDKRQEYIVVNNAGVLREQLETFQTTIDINLTAAIRGSMKALEMMRKDKGGSGGAIINVSSIAAILYSVPFSPIYNATKSGLMQFSVGIGDKTWYSRTGVRVLVMCFGATSTNISPSIDLSDEAMRREFTELSAKLPPQSAESAGKAVVNAYKLGKTASIWLSQNDKPAEDITQAHAQAYKILTEAVFK